ncbi:multiheme c-type cytochrome [uncultured Winogradskyella sp.]|uniref:multiheme c-type cytochrome n=1 Tax=uncultured Winogradskyella sp. TaxID=395353 RepID=UPI002634EB75|nr:multiheme c-type cytochrome [uncultured Winogradskyella sp.]
MSKAVHTFTLFILGFLMVLLFFVRCDFGQKNELVPAEPIAKAYDGMAFAGSESCKSCHKTIYENHVNTPHYQTSHKVYKDSMYGDFTDKNTLKLNDSIHFIMTAEDVLYQSGFKDGTLIQKEPFDVVIGSGTKGQTFLYWKDSKLYQLPVSYLVGKDKWIHSPGYANDRIHFNRAVVPNCLECHATYAKNHLPMDFNSNSYIKNEIIWGVDCESCHGPALKHVNAHRLDPELKKAKQISNIASLTRQQQLDACAKCHSGLRKPLNMPFTFRTGDKLSSFRAPNYRPLDTTSIDVHGNQYGLLTASECFKKSEALNCTTCHNTHKNERRAIAQFSEKCISCHNAIESHTTKLNDQMKTNCIDCHMPSLTTSAITFNGLDSIKIRTHKIGIYEDISKQINQFLEQ